ncbi:MAG: hypothetical protein AAFX50_19365, partial [Acidobacteriota bacterium]
LGGLSLETAARHLRAAEAACAKAETLDPGLVESAIANAQAHLSYARLATRLAEPRQDASPAAAPPDLSSALAAARAAGEAAVARAPESADAHQVLGEVEVIAAEARLFGRHGDAAPALERALRSFNRALEIEPASSTLLNRLGGAHNLVADDRRRRGLGSQASSRAAIDALERAVEVEPESFAGHSNLADSLLELAFELHSTGEPFAAEVERALDRARTALALNPEHLWTRGLIAQALLFRAQAAMAARRDPRPALDDALAEAKDLVSASGGMPELRFLYGLLLADAAILELQLDGDPTAHVEACGSLLAEFRRSEPQGFRRHYLDLLWATVALRQATRRGGLPADAVEAGERSLAFFDERPADPMHLLLVADFLLARAGAELRRGDDPASTLRRGLDATETRRGVEDAGRLGQRGAFFALAGLAADDPVQRQVYFSEADALLTEALEQNRWLWPEVE